MSHTSQKIVIANDHGALELKREIVEHLKKRGCEVINLGVDTADSVDYPDQAKAGCEAVLAGEGEFGILLCGTGIGISISANKIEGVRCALVHDVFTATMAKEHNNANLIAIGGRIELRNPVGEILDAFMDSSFGGERHQRRIDKIHSLE